MTFNTFMLIWKCDNNPLKDVNFSMIIIGIDPGISGAISILENKKNL